MKKLLLGLGAMTAIAAPVVVAVSCGDNNDGSSDSFEGIKPLTSTENPTTFINGKLTIHMNDEDAYRVLGGGYQWINDNIPSEDQDAARTEFETKYYTVIKQSTLTIYNELIKHKDAKSVEVVYETEGQPPITKEKSFAYIFEEWKTEDLTANGPDEESDPLDGVIRAAKAVTTPVITANDLMDKVFSVGFPTLHDSVLANVNEGRAYIAETKSALNGPDGEEKTDAQNEISNYSSVQEWETATLKELSFYEWYASLNEWEMFASMVAELTSN